MSEATTPADPKASVRHQPGTFCWWELATTDLEACKAFYGELFGWTYNESPIDENQVYVMFQSDGKDVGAAFRITPEMEAQGSRRTGASTSPRTTPTPRRSAPGASAQRCSCHRATCSTPEG